MRTQNRISDYPLPVEISQAEVLQAALRYWLVRLAYPEAAETMVELSKDHALPKENMQLRILSRVIELFKGLNFISCYLSLLTFLQAVR